MFLADIAHARNRLFEQFSPGIPGTGTLAARAFHLRQAAHHQALAIFPRGDVLPQLLGQEGHERVQHAQQLVEETERRIERRAVDRLLVGGLHHFEVPARKFVPEELIQLHQRLGNSVRGKIGLDRCERAVQHRVEPLHRQAVAFALDQPFIHLPALYEAVGVPDLIPEIASLFAERFVEQQVAAGGRAEQHRHAHAVGAVAIDQFDRSATWRATCSSCGAVCRARFRIW